MQQKKSAENVFSGMQDTLKDMIGAFPVAAAPFDLKTIIEMQRRNMQALTEANETFMSGWQAMTRRQIEMVSTFVQDNSALARETMTEAAPRDKFVRQTDIIKQSYERSLENVQELADMARKNMLQATDVLNRRIASTLSEIKSAARS